MSDPLAVLERPESPAQGRTLVVPDLGAGALAVLARLDEILTTLAAWEEAEDCDLVLPVPLAGERALSAVRRLWDALAPTQGLNDGVRLEVGQHVHLVEVVPDDLDVLAAIAVRLCQAASAAPAAEGNAIVDALEQHLRGTETTVSQLVADTVRLHSVLDLAPTVDEADATRDSTSDHAELVAKLAKVWSYATA